MSDQNSHVIAGASGADKSVLLAASGELDYLTTREASLEIVQEQQDCKGNILPSNDQAAFMREVMVRNMRNDQAAQSLTPPKDGMFER